MNHPNTPPRPPQMPGQPAPGGPGAPMSAPGSYPGAPTPPHSGAPGRGPAVPGSGPTPPGVPPTSGPASSPGVPGAPGVPHSAPSAGMGGGGSRPKGGKKNLKLAGMLPLIASAVGLVTAIAVFIVFSATDTGYVIGAAIAWLVGGVLAIGLLGFYYKAVNDDVASSDDGRRSGDGDVLYRIALVVICLAIVASSFEIALWASKG